MIIASQYHLRNEPLSQKKLFLFITILLQITLILTFMATELIIFYILFETTLIPTLIIITKWGNQAKRFNASTYFLFYTLTGSLPLLIILSHTYNNTGSLNITLLTLTDQKLTTTWSHSFT
ncbi:NADH-quinone oxidoreductase subunit M [Pseudomonas syringae pv. actinidiae]|nr:NADH-quinone oxidoreductase subunit M [Pseudomonas syringae pv. actinidiae]